MAHQSVIEHPPAKSPYFTLPDVKNFLEENDDVRALHGSYYASILTIFGPADKMSEDKKAEFLLTLIKHSEWKPDFEAAAKEWKLANPKYV